MNEKLAEATDKWKLDTGHHQQQQQHNAPAMLGRHKEPQPDLLCASCSAKRASPK
ncbi:hypothetical protein VTK26DRAFT_9077 [Humicola hyalothermophila]